ncbi:MAG: glucuronate isomerase, partial [Eubacterium sp.]
HNHLDAQAIYENKNYKDLASLWLDGDHYKWRAMRANGIPERDITGRETAPEIRFNAWAKTVPQTFGNPLYHWTHLELQRFFDITRPLNAESAPEVWEACNTLLATPAFRVRELIKRMGVKVLCTTNDPAEDLVYHKALSREEKAFRVLPTFRPEKAMGVDAPGYKDYIRTLEDAADITIGSYADLKGALAIRMDAFSICGCIISDHSLDGNLFAPATEEELEAIFKKAILGSPLIPREIRQFKGNLLAELGRQYHARGWAMQLHIGALRNNARRHYETLGPDSGFDSMDDMAYAPQLAALLNAMDEAAELPKTILYCLNPKDSAMLAAMIGNFQDGSIAGKIQLGTAWWLCDHKEGMQKQMKDLSAAGLLSRFVGMVTDSRSFLSFSRHEYFRRILCAYVGELVENGEYPNDETFLGEMIENICYGNALHYFEGKDNQ